MTIETAFGRLLVELRAASQFTQADLALRAGIAVGFVSLMERGQRSPSIDTIFRLANAFDVHPEDLVKRLRLNMDRKVEVIAIRSQPTNVTNPKRATDARALLATNVQQMRRVKGITQKELAGLAEIHESYVSRVERADINASANVIQKLAEVLSVPIDRLFAARSPEDLESLGLR